MKNINEVKKGQSVVFSSLPQTFTVKEIDTETGNVSIFIEGTTIERITNIKNIFPITEHVKNVSNLAFNTRKNVKQRIPFGVKINDKIMNKMFLNHWVEMCEAEGSKEAFETAKVKFNIFIEALTSSLEMLSSLKVLGVDLLAPIIPDGDDEN